MGFALQMLLAGALSWTLPIAARAQDTRAIDPVAAEYDGDLDTVAQHPEAGVQTSPLFVSLAGDAERGAQTLEQELCDAGAAWLRVRIARLALYGADTLTLTPTRGQPLSFNPGDRGGRSFFTRAFEGDCLRVHARLGHPRSRVELDALQSSHVPLALVTTVVAAVGDICDAGQQCSRTAALIAALNPVKLILAGDNAYESGTLAEYNNSYHPNYGPFKAKTHPAAGNHEYNTAGASGYFDYFNGVGVFDGPAGPRDRGYYSVDIGDWHVVVLNSNIARGPGSVQEQWLRADLAASTKPCTLASFHHPRFSIGNYAPGDASVQALYQALHDFKADLIIVGHDHNYQRWAPMTAGGKRDPVNGVRQILIGTGGRGFYAIGSSPDVEQANSGAWGVLALTLSPTDYAWEFLPVAGSTFTDSGSTACKPKGSAPNFALALTPTSTDVTQGGSRSVRVDVSSQDGFDSAVSLSCAGLPASTTCAFAPAAVTPPVGGNASSTLTLSASTTAATGTLRVAVNGSSGSLTRSANLGLTLSSAEPLTRTFTSQGANDGRTWESSETSNLGGGSLAADTSTSAIRVGDLTSDRSYRSIVSFDTSLIPDKATITAATLRLVRGALSGTNPFGILGTCQVDIRSGSFGRAATLANADFEAAATATAVASLSNPTADGEASTGTLNAVGLAAINKTGTTQLKLYFTVDDNDNDACDYIGFYGGEAATAANRPTLTVTYTP
jgi:hypothetical protein